jgi:hypothetical protein
MELERKNMVRKVRYMGVYPEVMFKGIRFVRGVWKDITEEIAQILPFDFEAEGKRKEEGKTILIDVNVVDEFDKLASINGIAKKTTADLRSAYNGDFDAFMADIKTRDIDKIPVRDDRADILIRHFMKEEEKLSYGS